MEKLTSPKTIEALLKEFDFRFNKRFGQNFLIDENIITNIIKAAGVTAEDTVIEVGPGIGTLTVALAEIAKQVYTVEIDHKLIPILKKTLAGKKNVTLLCDDILKIDINALLGEKENSLKIVANLPYYITTPIIMGFLESDLPIQSMTFLIQKEVGERLSAAPGTKAYGSLTIACQYYAKVHTDFVVPASVFMPRPKVDSVVVTFQKRAQPSVAVQDKAMFFKVVKAAFLNRRKTLINGLMLNLGMERHSLEKILEKLGHPKTIRGEALTATDFAALTEAICQESIC